MDISTTPLAHAATWQGKLFDGDWIDAAATLEVIEPGSGRPLHTVGKAGPGEVGAAVAKARTAQRAWAATPPRE
ncbi:MAG: aldehyde dehydrogenase family protein, partial [Pseudomonas sp.]